MITLEINFYTANQNLQMKLSQPVLSIQQPRSPQGIQTPQIMSPSTKSLIKIDSPESLHLRGNTLLKQRSCSINVQPEVIFTCVKPSKENKLKGKKQKKIVKPQKERQLRDMSPKEITNLLKENQILKDEILRMQNLIQEVVPVFNKITEEFDEESSIFKTHDQQRQQSRNEMINQKSSFSGKKQHTKLEEITFLEQSLRQLKCYYDQKDHPLLLGSHSGEDSEFLDAEDLDMTTLDERQTCGQRIKSALTFGQQSSTFVDNNYSPRVNSKVHCAKKIKTKLVDLNRQSKNFNMPMPLIETSQKKNKLINFDEIEKVKNLLCKINNTQLLKELRSNQHSPTQKPTSEVKSRNPEKIQLAQQVMSDNEVNESGFSDDPSIPADSFHKQPIHYNIMPQLPSRSKSPFNKFQVINMQQKYVESEKQLNKLPQKHEMVYPIQILSQATKNFNSCTSIESSSESENFTVSVQFNGNYQPIQTIQSSVSNRIRDSFTPEKKGISPVKKGEQTQEDLTPVISPITSNFLVSPSRNKNPGQYLSQPSTNKKPTLEQLKKALQTDNEKFAHYIREVNFDQVGNKDEISNDNMGVDFFFQSQSKDCFQFSQSIQSTDNLAISKRESVDNMLWMLMKTESPVKAQNQQKNPILSDDTMRMIYNPEDEIVLSKRLSSGFKRLRYGNKENALVSPQKSPQKPIFSAISQQFSDQQHVSPGSDIVVSKVLEESFPAQQVLRVKQEQRPLLEFSSGTSSYKKSLCKSNSTGGRVSIASGSEVNRMTRGKSLSQYNLADQVKQALVEEESQIQETEQNEGRRQSRRSPSFNHKWVSVEEKEKNLAALNQQIITRTHESIVNLNQNEKIKEDMQPSNNLKITQKLSQKQSDDDSLCMIDNSSLEANQQANLQTKVSQRESSLDFQKKTQQLVFKQIESPCIIKSPTAQQAKSMKQSPRKGQDALELGIQVDNSPLITLMNTSKTESESGLSLKSQNRYAKYINIIKQDKIQKELQVLDIELQKQEELDKKEKTYLETPSPRVLDPVIQTPQFTIDQLRIINEEVVTFHLDSSDANIAASEQLKKEKDKEILTSRRVSTADRREFETSSQKSGNFENIIMDLSSQQQLINKAISHERMNSCCHLQGPNQQLLLNKSGEVLRLHRGSEIEESPREPEFKMTKKPSQPVLHREVIDYAPRQTPIPEEGSSAHSSIVDIKISPTKDIKSQKDNTVIEEEPSDEEEDQSKPHVVAVDCTLINLVSDENSKASIGQVEMQEGEMFSSRGQQMMTMRDSLLQGKDTCQSMRGSEQPSNYNSSRYKTPLRQFINSGMKSQSSSQNMNSQIGTKNNSSNHSQIKSNHHTMESNDIDIQNFRTSIVKSPMVLSPLIEESKTTPQKKPFFISKRNTHHKSGTKKEVSASRLQDQVTSSENNTSRSQQKSNRDKCNKMRIDFLGDKCIIQKSFSKNEACESIILENTAEQVRKNSKVRSNYSSMIQKSANTTPVRTNQRKCGPIIQSTLSPILAETPQSRVIPTTTSNQPKKLQSASKQADLEIKLKEKEQRIMEIMNRKIQLEEQRQQIRLLKDKATLMAKKNDQQKLCLSKGLYLRKQSQETMANQSTTNTNINTQYNQHFSLGSISQTTIGNQLSTPTSHKQKIVLKKEHILQSFCNSNAQSKKIFMKPEKKQVGNSGIFCTIENLSQTPSQLRELPVQSAMSQLEAILGPQTERIYPMNFKDSSSPINGLQPTLRQVEFFKKIEDDCFKRKIKHQSRLEHVSQVTKGKQQINPNV